MSLKSEYLLFAVYALRVLLCVSPEHGYIQPDEFFQFTEPVAERVLGIKAFIAWEFRETQPIRSVLLPLLIAGSSFRAIAATTHSASPWLLLVAPRLVVTLLSFICDFCLYQICNLFDRDSTRGAQIVFATSYLVFTYCTHTFTNSLELILLSLLLLFVAKSVKNGKAQHSSVIGMLICVGFFNRATFLCFAVVPVIFWILSEKKLIFKAVFKAFSLLFSFALTSVLFVLVDTLYYRTEIPIAELNTYFSKLNYEELLSTMVVTPFNFVKYNIKQSNLQKHGLHPFYQHSIVNVPLAFTVIGLLAYKEVLTVLWRTVSRKNTKEKSNEVKAIMLLTFVLSLVLFSLIPHQEARFLIPCLLPLCFLYGNKVYKSKLLFFFWIISNCILVVIYGFVHQAGVTKALFEMRHQFENSAGERMDVIISRTYIPPQHLLSIPHDNEKFNVHDLSTKEFPEAVYHKLRQLKESNASNVYVIIPSCLTIRLETVFRNLNLDNVVLQKQIFPHFTFEDLRSSLEILLTKQRSSITNAFSMNIFNVKMRN